MKDNNGDGHDVDNGYTWSSSGRASQLRTRCLQRLDGGDKLIPARMDRLDVAGLLGSIAQSLAQLANTDGQHALTHRRLGPHGVEECVFEHHLPRLADQTP
jgi:hypothetical protein